MTPRLPAAVVALVFDVFVFVAAAPAAEIDVHALDTLIARTVEEKAIPGLSAGILHEGRVVLAKGYGYAKLTSPDPVTPETLFAIGSVTKQFTCAALLLLAEDGEGAGKGKEKLALDDRVEKWFPGLTRGGDVTLADLAQHVSGYPDYYPLDFVDRAMARPRPVADVIRDFATRPLDFEPGTKWSYSNTGYLILGHAIEKASGESFGAFLERRLLAPLGMKHTRYEPKAFDPGLAAGTTSFALGDPEFSIPEGAGWIGAAGGLWSTASDLLAWDLALIDGKVLSASSYRTMTAPRRLADGRSTGYGLGLSIREEGAALVLAHSGGVSGFNSRNTVVPATRSAVVLLANSDAASPALQALTDAILPRLLPAATAAPAVAGAPALEAAVAMLSGLRSGKIDRSALGPEFAAFFTEARVAAAAKSLAPLGALRSAEVERTSERGGMEVTRLRFEFAREKTVAAWMYRKPDGAIEEFLLFRP